MLMRSVIWVSFTTQEVLEGAFWKALRVGIVGVGQCMGNGVVLSSHLHITPLSLPCRRMVHRHAT